MIKPNVVLTKKLKTIDTKLEAIYLGALYTLNDQNNQDRIAQSAHSIRELTLILFRADDYPIQNKEFENENKQTLAMKIQKSIDLIGNVPPIYLKYFIRFNREIHKYFVNIAHHGHEPTMEEFTEKIVTIVPQMAESIAAVSPLAPFSKCIGKGAGFFADWIIKKLNKNKNVS